MDYATRAARIDNIEKLANRYHRWDMYRDYAYNELAIDPDRSDDEIAHKIAMAAAYA